MTDSASARRAMPCHAMPGGAPSERPRRYRLQLAWSDSRKRESGLPCRPLPDVAPFTTVFAREEVASNQQPAAAIRPFADEPWNIQVPRPRPAFSGFSPATAVEASFRMSRAQKKKSQLARGHVNTGPRPPPSRQVGLRRRCIPSPASKGVEGTATHARAREASGGVSWNRGELRQQLLKLPGRGEGAAGRRHPSQPGRL